MHKQPKPVAWQVKSKENGTWGPPFVSFKMANWFRQQGYEVRELVVQEG